MVWLDRRPVQRVHHNFHQGNYHKASLDDHDAHFLQDIKNTRKEIIQYTQKENTQRKFYTNKLT